MRDFFLVLWKKASMLNNRYKNDGLPELRLNSIQVQAKNEVEEKVNSGKYLFEEVKCAICGVFLLKY